MEELLPKNYKWCRKAKYNVQIELGCYELTGNKELLPGFDEKEINGKKYAVKSGTNILEQNNWTTSPERPYIITGTVGERWTVKASNIETTYDVNIDDIGITPIKVATKDPKDQEFLVAYRIPEGQTAHVTPSWAFKEDGSINESQIMIANSKESQIPHNGGDYIVAKHIPGRKSFWQLLRNSRKKKKIAELYDPRIVNGEIFKNTYDIADTQEEIIDKYKTTDEKIENRRLKILKVESELETSKLINWSVISLTSLFSIEFLSRLIQEGASITKSIVTITSFIVTEGIIKYFFVNRGRKIGKEEIKELKEELEKLVKEQINDNQTEEKEHSIGGK